MKGIYLQNSKYHKENNTGIYKKILAQMKAFNDAHLGCVEIIQNDGRSGNSLLAAIMHRLPFTNTTPKWEYLDIFEDIDYIYFRRPSVITGSMRRVLRQAKKSNPQMKVVMELPTYPYDHELAGLSNRTLLLKDQYNRKRLHGCVDRIAVIDPTLQKTQVFGIKAIPFLNGIDVDSLSMRMPESHHGIRILCVAYFSPWHGYERLIEGIANYYQAGGEEEVIVDMVGEGPELEHYKGLAYEKGVSEYIIFHGKRTGEELENMYNSADIGVVGLNWFKYGYNIIGDLKSREYLAKGLPVLNAGRLDTELSEPSGYILDAVADDSPIDIKSVVKFYHDIYDGNICSRAIAEDIREYAKRNVDMKQVMKKIVMYLGGSEK